MAAFPHADEVEVVWRAFQLDPAAPRRTPGTMDEQLAAKYGVSLEQARQMTANVVAMSEGEGLEVRLDLAKPGNTFDAHRLIHLAADHGLRTEANERLLRAYWTQGRAIGEPDTLIDLATELGLAEGEVRAALEGEAYATSVREDQDQARAFGIQSVPFFVLDRAFAVSGAQEVDVFERALTQAWGDAA
ncbi:MAG: DsbA family oxidoreductase [Trueperaceae bacterium]|nr:DsbA family oxidoreductase [Trueperaceae bacterium]